ncbi:MAG: hypothetical protein ABMA00_11605, partial [Gemmatimonas sp.]
MCSLVRSVAVVAFLSAAESLAAQSACGSTMNVASYPAHPRRGTLFVVHVTGASAGIEVSGQVAGEALHFSPGANDTLAAFAPAPIDSAFLEIVVACARDTDRDTLRVRLTLAAGSYAIERLRVAPRFSSPPDSVLAARMQREAARAADVSRIAHTTSRLWSQ